MQIRSNGRVYRSEAEWRTILSDYSASGVKMSEYCSRHGIAIQSMSKALQRYSTGAPAHKSFVEVLPIAEREASASWSGYRVELDLGNSLVLRIR